MHQSLGYTKVTVENLNNKVAQSFPADAFLVVLDLYRWLRHPNWPRKLAMLNVLYKHYPVVFNTKEEIVVAISESEFQEMVIEASRGRAEGCDGSKIFDQYCCLPALKMQTPPS